MKLIHITSKPPFPSIDGGCYASARLLNDLLELNIDIKHYTISTDKHPFDKQAYPEYLRTKISPENVQLKTNVNAFGFLKSWLSGSSYNLDRFKSSNWSNKILKEFRSSNNNFLVIDGLYGGTFLSELSNKEKSRVFVRAHNIEHEIWRGQKENCNNPFKKALLSLLYKRLKAQEIQLLKKCKRVLTLSSEDEAVLTKYDIAFTTLPVSIPNQEKLCDYSVSDLFHVGNMNWIPNQEAVEELIDIHQSLIAEISDLTLHLYGSGVEKFELGYKNMVRRHGFVEHVEDIFTKSGILISPIKSGSGIRIKLLEALSFGVPVVTTSLGAAGINTDSGILIAETKEEFIRQAKKLIQSAETRESLGTNGKEYISKEHAPKKVVEKLKSLFVES